MRLTPLLPLLVACTGATPADDTDTDVDPDTDTEAPAPTDWRARGDAFVSQDTDTWSVPGCDAEVVRFTPDTPVDPALVVVLTHGFSRTKENMAGLAELLASHGLPVITPDLCHLSFLDTDHPQNGRDLQALAAETGAARVIYAGFSAGGLASVLAASEDPAAIGVVGLDPVDAGGLGLDAVAGLDVPLWAVFGTPGDCNSDGNGLDWVADDQRLRISEAEHCDFESPTDRLCTGFCSVPNPDFADTAIQGAIFGLSIAAIAGVAGVEPIDGWWRPGGEYYEELSSAGLITAP